MAVFERLEVLEPRIFFAVGFARGGDVVAGPTDLAEVDAEETIELRAPTASASAVLASFAFDVADVPLRLVADSDGPWRALERRPSDAGRAALDGRVLLSTADASRLVPYVAIARAGFLRDHGVAAAALVEGWLQGQRMVDADREAAARAIAGIPGAPPMLTVLNDLRLVAPTKLTDNAQLMGLAGRGAVTLPRLFEQTTRWWVEAGLVTDAESTAPPIDASVVALVARRHRALDDDDPPLPKEEPEDDDDGAGGGAPDAPEPPALGDVILVQRLRGAKPDTRTLVDAVGWLAGIFPDAALELSVHPGAVADDKATARTIDRAATRFRLDRARLVSRDANGQAGTLRHDPRPQTEN